MKIAALYDIHGNPFALNAVLKEVEKIEVNQIIIGGDVIAGPMPNETLRLLEETSTPMQFLCGNAESEVIRHLDGKEINGLSERADQEAIWVSEQLSEDHKAWIREWKSTICLETDTLGEILFCHATPQSDVEVFTKMTRKDKIATIFEDVSIPTVICGHTHMQFEIQTGQTRILNAGSVGMPFGSPGAAWLLLTETTDFQNTAYDLDAAATRVRDSDYPHAEGFATNNILNPPTEQIALKMLSNLEIEQERSTFNKRYN
ncbi:metallophosphoesterase family protein [Robertkochia solimangrovi]|uniref:metallophosphoesterase family protein n=1 Tax=Robertkochia solimangrovi TaxID=2213046 RepID=UPI00117E20DC|nr:metallophosphoesterase family protein [Robertkochia solimangrovi]TRZ41633.1 metallophosphoesterase [Robertkochia solimangrovi]